MAIVELQAVKERLTALGVDLIPSDDVLLNFSIDKITNHIKNETNQTSIPDGAYEVAIDMVIADFLFIKYATGTIDIDTIDFNINSVKSVRDGDTNIDYGDSSTSPSQKFNAWLNDLFHKDYDWSIWRRLRW